MSGFEGKLFSTYRLLPDIVEHFRVNVKSLSLNLVGPASIVADAGDDASDVALGQHGGFAIVEGLDGSKEFSVFLNNVGELEHEGTALLRGDGLP